MTANHRFHPTVLREYDIRGVIGKTLGPDDARAIGQGFGTLVVRAGGTRVAIGYDGRLSSPELEQACVEGLMSTGLEVIRIGLGPTPMLYFTVRHLELDAGLMITGSHNPPDYNGFKMMLGKGPVYGEQIQEIGRLVHGQDLVTGAGSFRKLDVSEDYINRLAADYDGTRDLTIVWDAGNGAVGHVLRRLTDKLPGKHILLFEEVDGTFPNHHPDPTVPENLEDLIHAVHTHKADIGIGFDGDGDRIGAVDEHGDIIWGDQLLAIYAADVLKSHPGATIIADVKSSQTLYDDIAKNGGKPLMWKTGHSLLKAKMAETGSPLAGEMSGHIFFADKYYGFDDAPYCGVRLAGLVSREGSLAKLKSVLPPVFNTPEVRFQVDEERKFKAVDEIVARAKALAGKGVEVNDIDGVRVKTEDGWWLLRASNTQDVLVARAEAFSEAGLERLKGSIRDQLSQSGIQAPEGF
ncbi:phosphoglucomutase/phosphomannomutase PgmG [Nitrospirillum pindoramense]|uniref:Phosphomannomutase n=1 Tax=Nitrospirillum amazonense TaxID=28077 RepID=A0A560HDK1_9PROT|nr:phosphomannomutase/phosphoglucomutase [Nitrospirillum amazonense]TWB44437.1 phosphomannomutase [Nitrospirillum amazonense]